MTIEAQPPQPNRVQRVLQRAFNRATWFCRPLPDVVLIGAARAGSTAMYAHLIQHPKVKGPLRKELHYLNLRYDRGVNWYRSQFPMAFGPRRWTSIEATPGYLPFGKAPERLKETQPDARLLVTLRDPVERAISHWKFRTQRGHEDRPLGEIIGAEAQQRPHHRIQILSHGEYAENLSRWFDVFPRDQFLIIDAADLFADANGTMATVFEWLGLEPVPTSTDVRNASRSDLKETPDERAMLDEYYKPHDAKLHELLGRRFSWMD